MFVIGINGNAVGTCSVEQLTKKIVRILLEKEFNKLTNTEKTAEQCIILEHDQDLNALTAGFWMRFTNVLCLEAEIIQIQQPVSSFYQLIMFSTPKAGQTKVFSVSAIQVPQWTDSSQATTPSSTQSSVLKEIFSAPVREQFREKIKQISCSSRSYSVPSPESPTSLPPISK